MKTPPFVIGQWVSGSRFYGRSALLAALCAPTLERAWVVGLRRAGKTSLLKQLEHLAESGTAPVLPLFWDLQGVDGLCELGLSFADALLEGEETCARLGLDADEVTDEDAAASLAKLTAALAARGAGLLLLLDEAEEMVALERAAPGTAARLLASLAVPGARVVVASSPRLADLATMDPAAAFMEGFDGPFTVGPLAPEEARALLTLEQAPAGARPGFDAATVEALRTASGDHPMLLQMLGKRCFELGDAAAAIAHLEADRTLDHLFKVDLDLLTAAERELLAALARGTAFACDDPGAARLFALGLVTSNGSSRLDLPNQLLAGWLLRTTAAEPH